MEEFITHTQIDAAFSFLPFSFFDLLFFFFFLFFPIFCPFIFHLFLINFFWLCDRWMMFLLTRASSSSSLFSAFCFCFLLFDLLFPEASWLPIQSLRVNFFLLHFFFLQIGGSSVEIGSNSGRLIFRLESESKSDRIPRFDQLGELDRNRSAGQMGSESIS
jgi:hypothetical protein